jgi:D-alanyl-D-alanine carboxypeptidase
MPVSQNGYSANDRSVIRSARIDGTDVTVAVRTGAAGDLLLHLAERWHRDVEALRGSDGVLDCWGYAERMIRGSTTTLSNHASGTALDLRARTHPLGRSGTYTAVQVAAIRRILADCRGAVRWGGDYHGRKDEMHVEVVADEARCRAVLTALTTLAPLTAAHEEDIMPTADDIAAAVWRYGIRNGFGDTVAAQQILVAGEKRTADAQQALAGLAEQIAQLRSAGLDEEAITRAVTAALAARV